MNYRIAEILARAEYGEAMTKTEPILLTEVISRIEVIFRAQNASNALEDHPAANVPKVEVVDGSDVLFSLTGKQAQGVNWYDREKKPYSYIDGINDHWNTAMIGIDWGRKLYDPRLAFDPTRFKNPQVKVTFDENVCDTAADNNTLEIRAHVFDERSASPEGFLMTKEHFSWALVASEPKYVELPTDYVTRQIYLQTLKNEHTFTTHLSNVKIDENQGKKVPYDLTTSELLREVVERYGYVMEHAYMKEAATAAYFYPMATDLGYGVSSAYGNAEAHNAWTLDGGKAAYIGAGITAKAKILFFGVLPHGMMPVLMTDGQEIDDWYDVRNIKSLRLKVTSGATLTGSPTAQVITQQLRPY